MFAVARLVRSLLAAILIIMAGGGFLSTLVAVRLEAAGTSAVLIGAVATAYFAGLTVGALYVTRLIERVGHIRTFAACVSLFSISTLAYALLQAPLFWMGLRFIDGLCLAGVFVCLESWLNDRADRTTRGTILAAYMIAVYVGQSLGQLLLDVPARDPGVPFIIASMLISLGVIPVVLTRIPGPEPVESRALTPRYLFAISPLGVVGTVASGLLLGAFYGMGAVFARRLGLSIGATAWFMTIVILGGVALQWPLGRLSDRFDRRRVIVGTLAGTLVTTALAALAGIGPMLFVLAAAFGGLSFALYPLCVAHTNDHATPAQRVGVSGGLIIIYSVAAAIGPLFAAALMTLIGPAGFFVALALCAGSALAFAIWRLTHAAAVPAHRQQTYQVLPRTTPVAAALDPNAGGLNRESAG